MQNQITESELESFKKKLIVTICIILIIILFFNTVVFIKTGEIGVVTQFGAVQDRVMTAGINFKVPFIQGVKKINCKTQEMTTNNAGATKDLQDVSMDVSINYSVNIENATELYKTVGKDYKAIILTPTLADTIKSAVSEYTAEETVTKRAELSSKIYEKLNQRLNEQGINVTNVNIINLNFSEAYNQAIEEKQIATQKTLTAEQELETIKIEAEKKIAEAEGQAEANRILNESLTEENLEKQKLENQSKAIDKWNGQLSTYMASDMIPFLNIN